MNIVAETHQRPLYKQRDVGKAFVDVCSMLPGDEFELNAIPALWKTFFINVQKEGVVLNVLRVVNEGGRVRRFVCLVIENDNPQELHSLLQVEPPSPPKKRAGFFSLLGL